MGAVLGPGGRWGKAEGVARRRGRGRVAATGCLREANRERTLSFILVDVGRSPSEFSMPCRRALLSILTVAIATTTAVAGPRDNQLQQSTSAPIRHGQEIDAGKVGPAARGLKATASFPGGEIRDGRAYAFAREIPGAASYDGFAVAGPHLLIEGVSFTGPIDVYAGKPVVMRGVTVRTEAAAPWAVHTRPGSGPLLFLWSEAGAATTAGAPGDASRAQQRALYLRGDGAVVYRSHLSRTADGVQIHGLGTQVIETLIDALTFWNGDHNDGIQMLGRGADARIIRSRIVNANRQTSCLNLVGDRVNVQDNYLAGGGWIIYGGANANGKAKIATREVVVTGNIFGREYFPKGGNFGPVAYWDRTPGTGNVWQRNRFADGVPVEIGEPPSSAARR